MDKLKENKLNLNIPLTQEDREFDSSMNKTMKVFGLIADVFIKENVSLDESLIILEALSSAVQIYKLQGIVFEDIVNEEV